MARGARVQLGQALTFRGHASPTETGMILFSCLFHEAEADVRAWLASMVDMTTEEFDKVSVVVLVDIAEQLIAQPETRDFFARAMRLVGITEATWKKSLTPSSPDTDGQTP